MSNDQAGEWPSALIIRDARCVDVPRILSIAGLNQQDAFTDVPLNDSGLPTDESYIWEAVPEVAEVASFLLIQHELLLSGNGVAKVAILSTTRRPEWPRRVLFFNAQYQNVTAERDGVGG